MSKYKTQLIKKLKQDYYNDFAVVVDSVVFGFKYYIYGDLDIARKHYKRISSNCDLLKPCTVELINLN